MITRITKVPTAFCMSFIAAGNLILKFFFALHISGDLSLLKRIKVVDGKSM